jgi:hypothetical protein
MWSRLIRDEQRRREEVSEGDHVDSCVEYIRYKFGDDLTFLCNIKEENIRIVKELVVGWLLTRDKTITGKAYLKLYPIIYHREDYADRTEYSEVELGYKTDPDLSDPCGFRTVDVDKVLNEEKIVKILPAQPNTYYITVTYYVDSEIIGDCVAFSIGVMYNPDTKEIIEITKSKYYEWLRSYEFEKLIEKLKKTKSKSKTKS